MSKPAYNKLLNTVTSPAAFGDRGQSNTLALDSDPGCLDCKSNRAAEIKQSNVKGIRPQLPVVPTRNNCELLIVNDID